MTFDWPDLPAAVDGWREKLSSLAAPLQREVSQLPVRGQVGYYLHAEDGRLGVWNEKDASEADIARAIDAGGRAVGSSTVEVLNAAKISSDPRWVKAAYSPAIRATGEALNFFPGHYPGGIPNQAGPLASMLTSGLLGAGLGWGAGKLGQYFLPEGYGENLPRTGMLMGGLAGATPGALWTGLNMANGMPISKALFDNSFTSGEVPVNSEKMPALHAPPLSESPSTPLPYYPANRRPGPPRPWPKRGEDFVLHPWTEASIVKAAAFYPSETGVSGVEPVHINSLGQLLWDTGASPEVTGSTMGAIYAARQYPDPSARPGYVTSHQLGSLAMNAIGDYSRGVIAGKLLNMAVGTPYSAGQMGMASAAVGLVGALIPTLFGE